jgi:lactam utilization protein B
MVALPPAQTLGAGLFVCEAGPGSAPKPRLLDRVRQAIAARHCSRRTEKASVHWMKPYVFFHGKLYRTMLSDIAVQNTECWAVKAVDEGEDP